MIRLKYLTHKPENAIILSFDETKYYTVNAFNANNKFTRIWKFNKNLEKFIKNNDDFTILFIDKFRWNRINYLQKVLKNDVIYSEIIDKEILNGKIRQYGDIQ